MEKEILFEVDHLDVPILYHDYDAFPYWNSCNSEFFFIYSKRQQNKSLDEGVCCDLYGVSEEKGIRKLNYQFVVKSSANIVSLKLDAHGQISYLIIYYVFLNEITKYDELGREILTLKLNDVIMITSPVFSKKKDTLFVVGMVEDGIFLFQHNLITGKVNKREYGPCRLGFKTLFFNDFFDELIKVSENSERHLIFEFFETETLNLVANLETRISYEFYQHVSFLYKKFNGNNYNFIICRDSDSSKISYISLVNHRLLDYNKIEKIESLDQYHFRFPTIRTCFDIEALKQKINLHVNIRDLQNIILSFVF